ncbi:hypothetical protein [Robertmurraya siralis]|nr:hypothetical protein [Robertmurraya siralis]
MNRIEAYAGQNVTFNYKVKTDGKNSIEMPIKQTESRLCLVHHGKEDFPLNVVRDFELLDDGDPTTPMFSCEKCGGQMYPESDKGVHGIEYKLNKKVRAVLPGFSYVSGIVG